MDLLQQPGKNVSGQSVLPTLIENKMPARDYVVGEGYADPGKEIFDSPRKFRWIRFQQPPNQWKLISLNTGQIELFNLTTDPDEKRNLFNDSSTLLIQSELLKRLNETLPERGHLP
jgi:arylsulfatase A-like enzyme